MERHAARCREPPADVAAPANARTLAGAHSPQPDLHPAHARRSRLRRAAGRDAAGRAQLPEQRRVAAHLSFGHHPGSQHADRVARPAGPDLAGRARRSRLLRRADDGRARRGLRIAVDERQQACPLQPGATQATINVPADRRGWRALPRMCLSSSLPFGLFRAWGWITPDLRVLVYPRVGEDGAPPSRNDDPRERLPGGDEFAGLRDYRQGDALRHVAWKASARRGDLLVREFDRAAPGSPLRFDWFALPGVPREPRISRLPGWVCDAYAAAHPWILVLEDGRTFGPAMHAAHYHRCLAALAELP